MSHPESPDLLRPSSWQRIEALAGDASARRYSRLRDVNGDTAILVEYPPPVRGELDRDLEVLRWCRSRGLRVPKVLAHDNGTGRAVLTDLGIADAERTLESASAPERLPFLRRLLEPLGTLAGTDLDNLPDWNPPLDRNRLRWELAGFELWYLRHHRRMEPPPDLGDWLDRLASKIGAHPRRVCHRDYHLNNLLVGEDGEVGVIDIQDILVGPDTYDAVSLLAERSACRLIPAAERRELFEQWAHDTAAAPGWEDRAEAVRLQRGLKVLGTFARFTVAGRSGYRDWLSELAGRLAPRIEAAGAPAGATALLLD